MNKEETYPCEKCGKDTDIEEYVVNFGWCNECFDKSWDDYLKELGIDPNLPHDEIEKLMNEYYENMKKTNSNEPF